MTLQAALFGAPLTRRRRPEPWEADRLAALELPAFAASSTVLEVESTVLGCRVIFAGDRAALPAGEPLPVYRAAELAELARLRPSPADLRRVHAVKTTLAGAIRPATDPQEEPAP